MQLADSIRQKIVTDGPLSFRDFMEMCLYDPENGYYMSPKPRIGELGDFFTSSSLSDMFGSMVGKQLEEMCDHCNSNTFTVVEYGAGTGRLCADILRCAHSRPVFRDRLKYVVIEKSPATRERLRQQLPPTVEFVDAISELAGFTDCVLSNELLDNLSVHRVVMHERLLEVFVDVDENGFVDRLLPARPEVVDYFASMDISLPENSRTEVNLDALQWIRDVAASLGKGYVLTIDYGYAVSEMARQDRRWGTLRCYHRHEINDDPYSRVGEQDITTHVNFSAIAHWGELHGLATCGYTNQAAFLHALGGDEYLGRNLLQDRGQYGALRRYAMLKYIMFAEMGARFQVLLQKKGVMAKPLSGLRETKPL